MRYLFDNFSCYHFDKNGNSRFENLYNFGEFDGKFFGTIRVAFPNE